MLHQKYQIKMAISCWVEMNILFSSKFNLSRDRERRQGDACWRRLGAQELSWWIWTKAGRGHRRIGYRGKLLWCVIPLSVSQSTDWRGRNTTVVLLALTHSPSSTCININCKEKSSGLFSNTHTLTIYRAMLRPQHSPKHMSGLTGPLVHIQFYSLCQHTRGSSLASISMIRNGRCSFCWAESRLPSSPAIDLNVTLNRVMKLRFK